MHSSISNAVQISVWLHRLLLGSALHLVLNLSFTYAQDASGNEADFFESKIRPALIEHCIDCHGVDTDSSGGLLLDSKEGWVQGGDSGPALVPGKVEESLLYEVVSYDNPELQMPPDGKLPQHVVDDFKEWIRSGAFDPREGKSPAKTAQTGLPVERADEHWSYRPIQPPKVVPGSTGKMREKTLNEIDSFISRRLHQEGLEATKRASPEVLVRRLCFDLTGLPPTADQLERFKGLPDAEFDAQYLSLVDELLNSRKFGERFARNWMDVARYAESVTLRGFVLPEAWRYRNYLIDAFASDRPFDQMIVEQLAGDLVSEQASVEETQQQRIATAFLAMGNTNLERQDKAQLEMDYIDEQLEVIGRAFLGQTIGCARCHDHKFDPIPTADYYALAGILKSSKKMEHANVSEWVEQPLPLPEDQQRIFDESDERLKEIKKAIKKTQTLIGKSEDRAIPLDELPGVVVDDRAADLDGAWMSSNKVLPHLGKGYHYLNSSKIGSATFSPMKLKPGSYEVRISYTPHPNRADNASVRVFSAAGPKDFVINQRKKPEIDGVWLALGRFEFEGADQAYVSITNADATGAIVADAVQFLPVQKAADVAAQADDSESTKLARADKKSIQTSEDAALKEELEQLKIEKGKLESLLAERPKHLTLIESATSEDIPIHIRGDVHNLGPVVPRGFLTAIRPFNAGDVGRLNEETVNRLSFAEWIVADDNPLAARVYANRVWLWLMGRGVVDTPNNFGTTGSNPTHPELLDWLAVELQTHGWSTKHLVRTIVISAAYQRGSAPADIPAERLALAETADPDNRFYWRGHRRKLSVEALRDSMLQISSELELAEVQSTIRPDTKADYNYAHQSTYRSIYQPVFRNSLPDLYEAFDFADPSVSIGRRARSTVATQALVLMNHPWVTKRAQAAAKSLAAEFEIAENWSAENLKRAIETFYVRAIGRPPNSREANVSLTFLQTAKTVDRRAEQLELWIHSIFASLDFRYLE
ncbi:MAG: DUF1553 domain-containing protein [Pirellulaceae bacterium]